jgi:hypothetical protein
MSINVQAQCPVILLTRHRISGFQNLRNFTGEQELVSASIVDCWLLLCLEHQDRVLLAASRRK